MMRRLPLIALVASLAAAVAVGCGSDTTAPVDIETATFAPSLNVHLDQMTKTSTGLYYQDSVVGTGATVASGDSVNFAYTGWLTNGTAFNSYTVSSAQVGVSHLIPGVDQGIVGMKVGGTRKLVIPPSLGYGSADISVNGVTIIPSNSILVFNVTVLGINPSP